MMHLKKYLIGQKSKFRVFFLILITATFVFGISYIPAKSLENTYESLLSTEIRDRNGEAVRKYQNSKDLYASPLKELPKNLEELLLEKEDKYFYYHVGINPISIVRASFSYIKNGSPGGSSTITQQLVKILLGNEQDRSVLKKIKELIYSFALELHSSKREILTMYINSVYLGNQAQGFKEASKIYFGKEIEKLTEQEMVQLLAALSSPSFQNPWKDANDSATIALAKNLSIPIYDLEVTGNKKYSYQKPSFFEISSLDIGCNKTCNLTLDNKLTEQAREILSRNITKSYDRGVRNGAVVIIKVPENELLSIIGSKDPFSISDGSKINMALQPRPIGSTVKPFIYGKGFELGLRPYTLVDDREYKYPIATGFPLYPKNYDGQFRGIITLHEALSNSLNVPSVKVLEYVGLDTFYDFLESDLSFIPIQDLHSYQYGIALGGLEMDLLTLTHYFTTFTNDGNLKPLKISFDRSNNIITPPQSTIVEEKNILDSKYVQLVNKITSDRKTGVNQFGIKSNLNLTQENYAVKTGTSRDFHDSWVVGYTPDFVVGVWLGNVENTSLKQVSGQSGAGSVWQEIMELLFTTHYNKKTPFSFEEVTNFLIDGSIEYGLSDDNVELVKNLMQSSELILSPHDNDVFEFKLETSIPLEARLQSDWYIDGLLLGNSKSLNFTPSKPGIYEIEAKASNNREIISIEIIEKL